MTAKSPHVAFLVAELGRSGGMATVSRYARHLADHEGMAVSFVVCGPDHGPLPSEHDGTPVSTLAEARAARVDVAIATWWTTGDALFELDARCRIVFLQSLEHRFYGPDVRIERLGALGVLDLPADFIVIASPMQRLLERLRPDARSRLVRNGIDKRVFRPRPSESSTSGPLRVLVEGQPSLPLKGVAEAVAAMRAMREPATVTLAALDRDEAAGTGLDVDRITGGLTPEGMAALYTEHDVLLKLSRFEGLGLPPLEAMHVGVPSVLTPFMGNADYARHGENALIVGFDDHAGTVAALDLLARDADLRRTLSAGARRTAEGWPDARAASRAFAAVVRDLAEAPAPAPDAALRRLARGRRFAMEVLRHYERRDSWRLADLERSVAFERELSRAHLTLAEERLAHIHDLTSRPSYRAAHLAKRLARRPTDS